MISSTKVFLLKYLQYNVFKLLRKLKSNYYFFLSKKDKTFKCKICKNNQLKTIKKNLSLIKLSECQNCKIIFQNPMLSNQSITKFYKKIYRNKNSSEKFNLYKRGLRRGKYILEYIESYKSDLISEKNILEIGSGYGGIIDAFKKNNNFVISHEIDSNCHLFIENNLGIKNYIEIDKLISENKKFDIIIISHTLEHIYDLRDFFSNILKFCHKNTIVYIEVPNFNKLSKKSLKSIQIGHLWYFNNETIEIILSVNNFKILKINNKIQLLCKNIN